MDMFIFNLKDTVKQAGNKKRNKENYSYVTQNGECKNAHCL
jgi:hypothetical protein